MRERPTLISNLPAHLPLAVRRQHTGEFRPHVGGAVVHDHAVVGVYLSGSTRLWLGQTLVLRRGDVLLVPEGQPHGASAPGQGAELWGLMCCTGCLQGTWGEALRALLQAVRRGAPAVRHLEEPALAAVAGLLGALEAELARPGAHHGLMVEGLMAQLVTHLLRAAPAAVTVGADPAWPELVSEALQLIERRAAEALSLADVARHVHRTPAHVAAVVKQHTGRTVGAWILHGRMALARQLLRSGDAAVEAVAEQVGFASPSHFHRAFRRQHGLTPAAWRAAHRGRGA